MSFTSEKAIELEFGYLQITIDQTIEDRYRMLNFYIALATSVATVGVGLFSIGGGDVSNLGSWQIGIVGLSLLMWLIGVIFVLMMIRLRQAWYSTALAMNKLKDYMVKESDVKNLSQAFAWNTKNLPALNQVGNIHFYATSLIALMNSCFLGVAVYGFIAVTTLDVAVKAVLVILAVFGNLLISAVAYWRMLR